MNSIVDQENPADRIAIDYVCMMISQLYGYKTSPQFYVYVQTVDTRLFILSCGAVTWENEARNFMLLLYLCFYSTLVHL